MKIAPTLFALLLGPLSVAAQTFIEPAPQQTAAATPTAARSARVELADPAAALAFDAIHDERVNELQSRRPTFTLIRLDQFAQPQARMDLYFGGARPATRAELLALTDRFRFEPSSGEQTAGDELSLPEWRTLILPEVSIPSGAPEMAEFSPSEDLVIEFRRVNLSIACSMSWGFGFHGYDNTGVVRYIYAYGADGATFAAQARRDRNTNPNLSLQWRINGVWQSLSSQVSSQGAYMDYVGWGDTGCVARDYRVRIYMANEGYYSCLGMKFNAN